MPTAYLFATGLGAAIWFACFLLRRDVRTVQLLMSAAGVPLALSDLFYVPQYWRPQTMGHVHVGIEGVLFSMEAGGICAVIYAVVFVKHFVAGPQPPVVPRLSPRRVVPLVVPLLAAAVARYGVGTNIEWGLYAGLIAGAVAIAWQRPDLARPQLLGALTFTPVYAAALIIWVRVYPSVHDWFTLWRMPHWYVLGVPLEEIVFGGLFAAFWTGVYPMLFERRFTTRTGVARPGTGAGGRVA